MSHTIKTLTEKFSQADISVQDIENLFSEDINLLKFPLLPEILFKNKKYDVLNSYLKHIEKESYLIIHFFSSKTNYPKDISHFAIPYIDNLLAISVDANNLEKFIELNEQFPNSIGEQTILKLVKIYETEQNYYLNLPLFDSIEKDIILAFDKFSDKEIIVDRVNNHITLLPLYLKLAEYFVQEQSLIFLDSTFKNNLPNYMENYIEKLQLNRKLMDKFSKNQSLKFKSKI